MTVSLIERLSAYREQLVRDAHYASDTIRSLTLYPVTPREGKSTESIVAKLRRQPISLARMQDIVGCRVVVDTVIEQDALSLRIRGRFPDSRVVDRRVQPSHGYRAVHFVVRWRELSYEVQVRTRLQHAWAQAVERQSDGAIPGLKYGDAAQSIVDEVKALSDSIQRFEEDERAFFLNPAPRTVEALATVQLARIEFLAAMDSFLISGAP